MFCPCNGNHRSRRYGISSDEYAVAHFPGDPAWPLLIKNALWVGVTKGRRESIFGVKAELVGKTLLSQRSGGNSLDSCIYEIIL